MSSMRNAVQRRNHRERGQPEERAKWGLLEKHKDYSARAGDFNAKKAKLKALRQKVLEKNPDEFYFGMMSRKGPSANGKNSTGTVNGDRGNQVLSQEASRLYKTQDLGYIRTMRNIIAKEVQELEGRAKGIVGSGKKIIFVEDEEEQVERVRQQEEGKESSTDEDEDEDDVDQDSNLEDQRRKKLETRLSLARERLKTLADAEEALSLQRAKMAKSPSVGGVNKHGVRFKVRERKR